MTAAFWVDEPPPAKPRVFLSELARLLILQGLDVDTKTRGNSISISCQIRTAEGKRAVAAAGRCGTLAASEMR